MGRLTDKVVVVTGASSGIGKATALAFAEKGAKLDLSARRIELVNELAEHIREKFAVEVRTSALDVRDTRQVNDYVAAAHGHFGRIDILVNNAGLALGLSKVSEGTDDDWETMLDTNVMGVLRVTRAVLPIMEAQDTGGHIINLGSLAGHVAYEGGSVYCASKHGLRALTEALRQEVNGKPIRVTSVDPGMVETEFSVIRFHGDAERAGKVYQGMTPLTAEDIADCILFAASRPPHVNIDKILVNPTDQAGMKVARRQ